MPRLRSPIGREEHKAPCGDRLDPLPGDEQQPASKDSRTPSVRMSVATSAVRFLHTDFQPNADERGEHR